MTFRTDRDMFARHVAELERHILGDPDMAPLIVSYTAGGLVTNDGNHRLQAYKNLGIASVPVIIWLPESELYAGFMGEYGIYAAYTLRMRG